METIVNQEGNYPGRSTGQSVKQASGIVTVTEGKHLSLSCSYEVTSSAYRDTYWYIQHPGQPLKLLLSQYKKDSQGFYATHHKGEKNGTYNLEKDASQLKDSAVYFCAFRRSTGQMVKQKSDILTVAEGKHLSLSCSYEVQFSSSAYRDTYWYIQHPGQPLELLLSQHKKDTQGFHATHHKGEKNGTYNLEKDASQLKDSAVYFCAFRETQ
ncbi:hypothetical protein Chor_009612 [Crotalus horridus]